MWLWNDLVVDFIVPVILLKLTQGAGHVERESNIYVEVIVDVCVVTCTSHLFSPVFACGMLCESTLSETATMCESGATLLH